MDARLFNVFLDAGDDAGTFVGQSVNVELGSLLEKLVDQNRPVVREVHGRAHVLIESLFVVNDCHGPAAENVAWSHQHRITNALRDFTGLFD